MSVEKRIIDITEKYAIMCKKANEYIKIEIKPNTLVYSKLKNSNEEPAVYIVTSQNMDNLVDPIRVFSQREIERLIYEPGKTIANNFLDIAVWVKSLKDIHYLVIDSMEKLMLCYLMEKIYYRLWDGNNWVSE